MTDTISAYLAPFGRWDSSISVEDFLRSSNKGIIGASIEHFFDLKIELLRQDVLERYAELSPDALDLQIVPYTQELWQSLINPLRLAKRAYAFGDHIVTIALTGMVSEMLALVTFEVYGPVRSQRGSTRGRVYYSFEQFERLGQGERIEALKPLLQPDRIKEFDLIRKIRREYLHFWTKSHARIREDAKRCLLAAMSLLLNFLDPGIQGTSLTLHPQVLAALKRWQKTERRD